MSQENVETVRRALAAWNADNLDAFLAELDPEVEWHPSIEPALEGRETVYRGHDGARRAWDEYRGEAWGGLKVRFRRFATSATRSCPGSFRRDRPHDRHRVRPRSRAAHDLSRREGPSLAGLPEPR